MKIGINLLLWTGRVTRALAPQLEAIGRAGFDGVELPVFDPADLAHYRDIAAMLDDLGLERTVSTALPADANPLTGDARAFTRAADYLARLTECCAVLGATRLVGPTYQPLGAFTGEPPTVRELDHAARLHAGLAAQARAAGVVVAMEPLNRFEAHLLNTAAQGAALCDMVADPAVGILYDTFHAHIEEQDPLAALAALHARGHLAHVHLSENDRGTPGRGHAKLRETIHLLQSLGYDGWLTIEAFGRAVPELAAATRVWRDFFADPQDVVESGYDFIRACLK